MTRPLAVVNTAELESLYLQGKADRDTLENLVFELTYRYTHRAGALLVQAQRSLKTLEKFHEPTVEVLLPEPVPSLHLAVESAAPPVVPPPKEFQPELLKMASVVASPEHAYQILKVPASASWEQVEQSRRELVAKAQPDRVAGLSLEKRQAVQDESRLVNAAYRLLLQRKG